MYFFFTYRVADDSRTYEATIYAGNQREARALLKRTSPEAINIRQKKA